MPRAQAGFCRIVPRVNLEIISVMCQCNKLPVHVQRDIRMWNLSPSLDGECMYYGKKESMR